MRLENAPVDVVPEEKRSVLAPWRRIIENLVAPYKTVPDDWPNHLSEGAVASRKCGLSHRRLEYLVCSTA
jgi:hypothetical protein